MQPSTRGYSPEQIAIGSLEDGKEVVILYIKEFVEQLKHVGDSGSIDYYYTWSYLEESDSFVLFISWDNGDEVAILFPPNQHYIIEGMKSPKELIITGIPVNELVEKARDKGNDFFDLTGPVVYINDIIYKDPDNPTGLPS